VDSKPQPVAQLDLNGVTINKKSLFANKTDRLARGINTTSRTRIQKLNAENQLDEELEKNYVPSTTLGGRSSNSGRGSQRTGRRRNAVWIGSFEDLMNQVQPINLGNFNANYIQEESSTDDFSSTDSEDDFSPARAPSPMRRDIRRNGVKPTDPEFRIENKAKPIARAHKRRNGILCSPDEGKMVSEWLQVQISHEEKMEMLRIFKLIQNAKRRGAKFLT